MLQFLKTTLSLTVLLLVISFCSATSFAETNWQGGLYFNGGFPQGDFKDELDNEEAFGIGCQFFYTPEKSPLAIGIEGSWMNYGHESRTEPFSTTIPDVTVDVSTNNNIAQGFLVLRGHTMGNSIRLYGDALIGVNYMFTETEINDNGLFDDKVASSVNQDDASLAYGFGGGVQVPIYTKRNEGDTKLQICFDSGVRYIFGQEAEYLKEGSIERNDTKVTFECLKSKTDMLRVHAGIAVRF